jgi:hypothetical protein
LRVVIAQINLAGTNLCGVYKDYIGHLQGTYTAEGIKAIADSIAVTASLTQVCPAGNTWSSVVVITCSHP